MTHNVLMENPAQQGVLQIHLHSVGKVSLFSGHTKRFKKAPVIMVAVMMSTDTDTVSTEQDSLTVGLERSNSP